MNLKKILIFLWVAWSSIIAFSYADDIAISWSNVSISWSTDITISSWTVNITDNPNTWDTKSAQNTASWQILLKSKIVKNYKVQLDWNKNLDSQDDIMNFVLLVSYNNSDPKLPAQDWTLSFPVNSQNNSTTDWHAKKWVTYYRICAVMQDEKTICSNVSKVVMWPNWEPAYGINYPVMSGANYMSWTTYWSGNNYWDKKPTRPEYMTWSMYGSGKNYPPMSGNQNKPPRNQNDKPPVIIKNPMKSFISANLRKKIEDKLNSIPDDKKIKVFTKIIENIDNKISSVKKDTTMWSIKKENLIWALNELKMIIQNKINELNNNVLDSQTINSLFEWTAD